MDTYIEKNIILRCFKKLSHKERVKYNDKIFPLIRNLTRYTYETILQKRDCKIKNFDFYKRQSYCN